MNAPSNARLARRGLLPLAIATIAALTATAGCSPKPGAPDAAAPTAPSAAAPATSGSEAGAPTSDAPAPSAAAIADGPCARAAADGAPDAARRSFPDNPDVAWAVLAASVEGSRSVVEVEPTPSTVGYPRFQLVFECAVDDPPVLLGAYALDGGAWTLLFTTGDAPSSLPPTRP